MQISQEKFSEIAQANDIVDIVSGYMQIKKRGKSFLALCPFHPDKNPSLHISQEKQVYHCFSCKASGNVFSFVQNYEKITFMDAVQKLALRAGIELRINSKDPDRTNEISKLFEINKAAARFFYRNLQNLSLNEKEFVYNYLATRNIDPKLTEKFGIGYSSKSWDALLNHFLEENIFTASEVEKAGLLIQRDSDDKSYYDRFRGRLIFPIFSENDKVVGFGGRKLYDDDLGGKYINSPETKIYNKSKVLYGLNFAKEKIRYYDYVILVEGYMDIISLHKNGIENVVASSGTALTSEQVQLISRYTKNVYVLFDSDFAGIKAARRGIEIILEAGLDLSVVSLPENEDPDSFINKFGKEEFEQQIQKRKSVINFISELYEKEGKLESVNDKTDFIKEIINYIGKMPDKIKRAFYIKEISGLYSLYESDMRDEIDKAVKVNKSRAFPKSSVVIPHKKIINGQETNEKIFSEELDLIDLFINGNDEAITYLENNLETASIKSPVILKILEYFLDEYIDSGKIEISKALNDLEDEESKKLVAQIAMNRHEVSYFSFSSSDRLLDASVEQGYNIKYAKDV
ncbi:MAG: DNA primase, partial [Bacteroidota bacterium]|nr:DNA primase [Bacteroidota bacterium]